jgi:DNA repair exonuclease SbcCD ATPase subunit
LLEKIFDLEKLKDFIRSKEDEISILTNKIESFDEYLKEKDIFIKNLENDISNYIIYINENIHTSLKWADTYLGVYMHSGHTSALPPFMNYENLQSNQANRNIIENSYSNTHSHSYSKSNNLISQGKVKFNLDQFSHILLSIQKRLNRDIQQYEETIYELKNENSELSQRIDSLLNENSNLKEERVICTENQSNIQGDLHKYKKEFEYYKNLYEITDKKKKDIELCYNSYFEELISNCKITFENLKNSSNSKISEKVNFNVNNSPTQNLVRK